MKYFSLFLILIINTIITTATGRGIYVSKSMEKAIEIAVNDFFDKCKLSKNDSVFVLNIDMDENDILGISISGRDENKFYPSKKDSIGGITRIFPSAYIEKNNKIILYWTKEENVLTKEMVDLLVKYNQIDSTFVSHEKAYPEFVINESLKGADYYFCKSDYTKFKRVITKIAMGWYPAPKLKCK